MKLNRPILLRTASAAVAVAALTGGLAAGTVPAHASTRLIRPVLEVCNLLSTNVTIDIWQGSTLIDKVKDNDCQIGQSTGIPVNTTLQLFIDNEGVEVNQLTLLNNDPITVDLTGTATDIHQGITIN